MASTNGKYGKIKHTRNIERTRKMIIDAAVREFADLGMEGARVDAIAKAAKINKGMIYYIFGSKEELFLSAMEALLEEQSRGINPPAPDTDVIDIMSKYFDGFALNYDIVRMIQHDIASGATKLRILKSRRPDLFAPFGMVSDLLKKRMDEGKLAALDPDKAVATSIYILFYLVAFRPHVDLMREPGTPAHDSLSDLGAWKSFLTQLIFKLVT